MGGKKTENTKKVAGNAKKAAVAATKAQAEHAKVAAAEDKDWQRGEKNSAKKEQAEAKRLALAAKKAEKESLLAAEEATLKTDSKPGAKSASKKSLPSSTPSKGTLDLSALDSPSATSSSTAQKPALNASGINDALTALSLTASTPSDTNVSIDRHPERRFKAAYTAFEERRLREGEESGEWKGLRRQQRVEAIRKEFERSGENPFNQEVLERNGKVRGRYDMSAEEARAVVGRGREGEEGRLAGK